MSRKVIRSAIVAVLVWLLAVAAFWFGRSLRSKGLLWYSELASVGSFALAAVGLLQGMLAVVPGLRRDQPTTYQQQLGKAEDDLASALRTEFDSDDQTQRINDPLPMPIFWHAIYSVPVDKPALRHPDANAEGRELHAEEAGPFAEIIRAFDCAPANRLMILGAAGAGKSVIATRLASDILARRTSGTPVPVIFPLAAWDPAVGILEWIEGELLRRYSALANRVLTVKNEKITLAKALVTTKILPILDGLDEIPEMQRAASIIAINSAGSDRPIVVTSRPGEYRRSSDENGRAISRVTEVELLPLTISSVKSYLIEATSSVPANRWDKVFSELTTRPDGKLAKTLTSPLMLWLARTIYDHDRDPDELAHPYFRDDQGAIEGFLLDEFIPAIYQRSSEREGFRCSPRNALRWFSFLAISLAEQRSQEIAWWRLGNRSYLRVPVSVAIRTAISVIIAWMLVVLVLRENGDWRAGAYFRRRSLRDLILAGPVGIRLAPLVNGVRSTAGSPLRAGLQFLARLLPWGSLPAITFWITVAVAGPLAVLAIGAFVESRISRRALPSEAGGIWPQSLRSPFTFISWPDSHWFLGLGLTVLSFSLGSYVVSIPFGYWRMARIAVGLALKAWPALLVFVLFYITRTAPALLRGPTTLSDSEDPVRVLRADRQAAIAVVLVRSALTTGLMWLCFGSDIALAYALFRAFTLPVKDVVGGFNGAAQMFTEARIWLACGRRMPWRTMTFLADAHRRGVLRRIGYTYEFRHIRLLERLASHQGSAPRGSFRWLQSTGTWNESPQR
jgi:NACHT domain